MHDSIRAATGAAGAHEEARKYLAHRPPSLYPSTINPREVTMDQRKFPFASIVFLLSALMVLSSCARKENTMSPVERGKYLVMAGSCNDCHSPKVYTAQGPVFDTTRLLSGHPAGSPLPPVPKGVIGPDAWGALTTNDLTAWAGPWGVSFAYNLTPDPKTGIGNWTEEMFISTLRSGKFMGMSRDILPPMPWQTIGQMSDDDLRAVFAYLKSLPPIENPIPPPIPPAGN